MRGESSAFEESFRKKACAALNDTVALHIAKRLESVPSFDEFGRGNRGKQTTITGNPPSYEDVKQTVQQNTGGSKS